MQISRGKIKSAQKFILYAPAGFGKSTFASKFPDPLYIDTEGSTKQLDVKRLEADFSKWENIIKAVDFVIENPDCCKTLVIDTVDWAENACITLLNDHYNTPNILTMDYGRGSLLTVAEFERLIKKLDQVIDKGIHVVLLAHAVMRKQELPDEMGAFDRWELKLQSKQVKALVKEWADLMLFGNYKTIVVEDAKTKSKKAQGGKRVLYTSHRPTWDAKNRHSLEDCIPFEYEQIAHIFAVPAKAEPEKTLSQAEPVNETEKKSPKAEAKKPEKDEKPPKTDAKSQKKETFTSDQMKARAEGIKKLEGIPPELKKLMLESNVTDWDLQGAVGALKNPYDTNTPIQDYSPEFVNDMISHWDKVLKKIEKIRDSEEIPF